MQLSIATVFALPALAIGPLPCTLQAESGQVVSPIVASAICNLANRYDARAALKVWIGIADRQIGAAEDRSSSGSEGGY